MQRSRGTGFSRKMSIRNRDFGLPLGHIFVARLSHPLRATSRVASYLLPSSTTLLRPTKSPLTKGRTLVSFCPQICARQPSPARLVESKRRTWTWMMRMKRAIISQEAQSSWFSLFLLPSRCVCLCSPTTRCPFCFSLLTTRCLFLFAYLSAPLCPFLSPCADVPSPCA